MIFVYLNGIIWFRLKFMHKWPNKLFPSSWDQKLGKLVISMKIPYDVFTFRYMGALFRGQLAGGMKISLKLGCSNGRDNWYSMRVGVSVSHCLTWHYALFPIYGYSKCPGCFRSLHPTVSFQWPIIVFAFG